MIRFYRAHWLICALLACRTAGAELTLEGLTDAQETNARILMSLTSADCDAGRWRIERLFDDGASELEDALQALGFYDISVEQTLDWDEECWHATFKVDVGEPVRYELVDVQLIGEVEDNQNLKRLAVNAQPSPGDILNHGRYESFKRSLLATSARNGYFNARFERNEIIVDPQSRSAELYLQMQSGPRFTFGEISFTAGILDQRLLENYTDIRTGDPYSADAINRLYEALSGSGFFGAVSISAEPPEDGATVIPVDVSLTPSKRIVYTVGAGFATDTGPQGRVGYVNRRRNQKGHQFESRLFGSPVKSELTASYRWPRRDPRSDWYTIVAGVLHEETDTSESDVVKLGIQRSKNVGNNWLQTRYLDIVNENFKIADQDTSSELIILGVTMESVLGRDLSRSTGGRRLSADLRGTDEAIGSSTSFVQLRASGKWLYSFTDRTRILMRVGFGITAKDTLTQLPATVRYFAGGDRSVRGYEFQSLGPVNADGEVVGGSNLIEGSVEFDYLFKDNWAVAVFADTGSAFSDIEPDFSTGVGLGLRWYSPVGPVRVDFAHPLDDPDSDFRLHISLGPDL